MWRLNEITHELSQGPREHCGRPEGILCEGLQLLPVFPWTGVCQGWAGDLLSHCYERAGGNDIFLGFQSAFWLLIKRVSASLGALTRCSNKDLYINLHLSYGHFSDVLSFDNASLPFPRSCFIIYSLNVGEHHQWSHLDRVNLWAPWKSVSYFLNMSNSLLSCCDWFLT